MSKNHKLIGNAADLFDAMQSRDPYIMLPNGTCGLLQSVQREDGSGYNFNVHIQNTTNGGYETHFVGFRGLMTAEQRVKAMFPGAFAQFDTEAQVWDIVANIGRLEGSFIGSDDTAQQAWARADRTLERTKSTEWMS